MRLWTFVPRTIGAVLAASLALSAGTALAQTAVVAPATATVVEPVLVEPVPVAPDAPMGSSGQAALGAGIGLIVGIAVLALALSSSN